MIGALAILSLANFALVIYLDHRIEALERESRKRKGGRPRKRAPGDRQERLLNNLPPEHWQTPAPSAWPEPPIPGIHF